MNQCSGSFVEASIILKSTTMVANVGSVDRMFRLTGGIGIAIWGIIFETYWGLVGVVLLATAVFSYCPLYQLFRIDTTKKDEQKETDQPHR